MAYEKSISFIPAPYCNAVRGFSFCCESFIAHFTSSQKLSKSSCIGSVKQIVSLLLCFSFVEQNLICTAMFLFTGMSLVVLHCGMCWRLIAGAFQCGKCFTVITTSCLSLMDDFMQSVFNS